MTRTLPSRRATERGLSLLEAMISLTVLLIGMVAMVHLQIYGMGSTQGARAQTIATQLATELGNALAQLDASDARLNGTASATPGTPPPGFGRLVGAGLRPDVTSAFPVIDWSDANPVPGARLDAAIERDPEFSTQPVFKRRWTVWDAGVAANGTAAKVIAVSVIFRERSVATRKEVVLYVHSEIKGSFMANINAFN